MGEKDPVRPGRRRGIRWIILLLVIGLAGVVVWKVFSRPRIEPGTVLIIDVGDDLPERSPSGLERLLGDPGVDFIDLARALEHAAVDERVSGVLLRVRGDGIGLGKAEELRGLLGSFRRSGKFVVAHAGAPGTVAYFLAAAADEVLLERGATLDAVGLRLGAYFLKDALGSIGIEPDLVRAGDWKGAFELLSHAGPTREFDESMNQLADSLYQTIVQAIASDRKLDEAAVRSLFDRCPLTSQDAVREKLIDGVGYAEEVRARLVGRAGKEVHPLRVEEYLPACPDGVSSGKWIAVVHILGLIVDGESRELSLAGKAAGADTVTAALREASEDPSVVGILLRIDSPGGSAAASERIFAAVDAARKRKPLIASLGGTAASGGYYAAAAADRILAQRTSLTGSIGVFGGKIVIGGLLERLQVHSRSYERGRRAGMYDFTRPFTPDERLVVKEVIEDTYRRFVDRVAGGRKRSFEDVHAVAQGKVWTGQGGLEAGLVDTLGGLPESIDALRTLARVPPGTPVGIRLHPPRESLWDILRPGSERKPALREALRGAPDAALHAALGALFDSRLFTGGSGVTLLPFKIEVR